MLSDLPSNLLMPGFFGSTVYHLTPLRTEAFGVFMAIVFLQALAGSALGVVVGAIAPSLLIANALAPPFAVVFILLSGFIINVDSLPQASTGSMFYPAMIRALIIESHARICRRLRNRELRQPVQAVNGSTHRPGRQAGRQLTWRATTSMMDNI